MPSVGSATGVAPPRCRTRSPSWWRVCRRRALTATFTAMRCTQASGGASGRQRGQARRARVKVSWAQSSAAARSPSMPIRVARTLGWLSR